MTGIRSQKLVPCALALLFAGTIWLPVVHLLFVSREASYRQATGVAPKARDLAARHLHLWTDPGLRQRELERMRRSNAEWDFMGRSFLVWSLAEMSLREPASARNHLPVMDRIIVETLDLERERGIHFFLMPYAKARPFVENPERSLFVDSEIALMLAMRRLIEEKPGYHEPMRHRIDAIIERMRRSKALVAESYPDECWLFDHCVALAAIRLADHLDGTDHSAFLREWLAKARQDLIDPKTGLLVSSSTTQGAHLDGPEGTSIWMAAHCLRLVDEDFALDQYQRARQELGRELCGFAWSREWPASWQGPQDIDSGAVVPLLDISAGGSGLAFVGASSFGDTAFLSTLHTTLEFAGFPKRDSGRLRYCASNPVGDAVMLYACVLGPAWDKVKGGKR
jgi:hypothetical protein